MKKLLLSTSYVLLLFGICSSQASLLLLNENFTGLTGIGLRPSNGQWSNANSNAFVQVNTSSPLYNPNYPGGGQYVTITNSNSADNPYKSFNNSQSIPTTANTVVYISFLVRVDNASGTVSAGNNVQTVLALGNNGSNDRLGFFIGNNGSGANDLKFGIKKSGSNGATFAGGSYSFGATHLIILKYVFVSGSNNDLMYMWVDPAVSAYSELSESVASLTLNSGGDNNLNLNSVGFIEISNGAIASFDALRVSYATNWGSLATNSVSAWLTLFSGQPLPVKFGSVKATAAGTYNKIEWEVYSEENLTGYAIERSADGQSFEKIAGINSFHSAGKRSYDYSNTKPLGGINFYRIRGIDKDGKSLSSNIVKVNSSNTGMGSFTIYPNPAQNSSFSIQLSNFSRSAYTVQIINQSGIAVYRSGISLTGIAATQSYQLGAMLSPGRYTVQINGNGLKLSRPMIVL